MLVGRGSADSNETRYRADIDGLRGVAVLSVIAFHLSKHYLPGGYLGVDVFLVLSGYLITNILWREALQGSLSISRFYERRIRRIMPALLVLLGTVSAISIALLLPIDLKGYAKSLVATLAFVANIYFWRDTNYFSRLAEEKPLLHLWSLGIEEQFYLVFPLLVLLCVRWRRSVFVPVVSVLVALSLLANILAIRMGADSPAFFLIPTRAWELGAGALLAVAPAGTIPARWLREGLALAAAMLLAGGLCYAGSSLAGYMPAAALAVTGTALAVGLGAAGGSWLTYALSRPVLVWVGLVSYSLYLWHWPILVFSRYYLVRDLSNVEAAGALLAMLVLAALSWRYVERPFRNRTLPLRKVLIWVAAGWTMTSVAGIAILWSGGFPQRLDGHAAQINAAVGSNYRCGINDYFVFGASRGCFMSLPSHHPADATVALLGNSHAQMYTPLVADILRTHNQTGILVPVNGCLPLTTLNVDPSCMPIAARNLAAVEALSRMRIVILGLTWDLDRPLYTPVGLLPAGHGSAAYEAGLDQLIDTLERRGKTVVLIGPLAIPGWDAASIIGRKLAFGRTITEPLFLQESTFLVTYGPLIAHFEARHDLIFIRPDRVQCREGQCEFFRNGTSLFADSSHIAAGALPLFRPVFESALDRALTQAIGSTTGSTTEPGTGPY